MKVKISLPVIIGVVILVVGIGIFVSSKKSGKKSSEKVSSTSSVLENSEKDVSQVNQNGSTNNNTENLEPSGEVVNGVREIKVTAKQWEFQPNPIVVNAGEKVRLLVISTDVSHGFALPDFGINEVLNPGEEVKIEFEANKKGTFEFFCSVSCGIGHSGMRGKLVVK